MKAIYFAYWRQANNQKDNGCSKSLFWRLSRRLPPVNSPLYMYRGVKTALWLPMGDQTTTWSPMSRQTH